ncbi:MAG: HNH endonuclease [Nitrospirota bacterium]|nr:HNH endonuclease [Nitrospirota bacterium]
MNKIWTRDQLLGAFNLYCKIPFSKTKANNPLVIEVARLIGRSPASVAMKLGNFGSFDPALRIKGIKGLSRASRADRDIWDEFNQNWEKLSIESELATERLRASHLIKPIERDTVKRSNELYSYKLQDLLERPSEKFREVKVRLHQRFFREAVLASYGSCCCVCSNPVPQLLTAGHIIPWAEREDLRANPRNGLCLCSLHHDAFDYGLWTLEDSYEIRLSPKLVAYLPNETLESNFIHYSRAKIRMPDKFWPEAEFLAFHRTNLFLG